MSDALLNSLAAAVAAAPEDPELRALYAARLADAGRRDEAVGQAMVVLAKRPGHAAAQGLVDRLIGGTAPGNGSGAGEVSTASDSAASDSAGPDAAAPGPSASGETTGDSKPVHTTETPRRIVGYQPHGQGDGPIYARDDAGRGAHGEDGADRGEAARDRPGTETPGVDWRQLEREFDHPIPPPFIAHEVSENPDGTIEVGVSEAEDVSVPVEQSRETLRLSDVGGLEQVKQRIRETFLDPIAHPEIARAFKKSLGGGLLLYGPPGCGKTYLARAIAGELGAHFISVTLADVLSKWMGESEGNIHKTFIEARQKAPAVLFLDEIDAVGGKRSSQSSQWLRNLVNQLLMEMDGVGNENDGLFVLAATNMPWDVDPALLRPGRFDRVVLVSPPDEPARAAILRSHLEQRPIQGIDLDVLVRRTAGFSGADLKHLCDTAAEKALAASIASGAVQPVSMGDMNRALKEVGPSIGPWLDSARNVASYANTDGRYDDLVQLLKQVKRL